MGAYRGTEKEERARRHAKAISAHGGTRKMEKRSCKIARIVRQYRSVSVIWRLRGRAHGSALQSANGKQESRKRVRDGKIAKVYGFYGKYTRTIKVPTTMRNYGIFIRKYILHLFLVLSSFKLHNCLGRNALDLSVEKRRKRVSSFLWFLAVGDLKFCQRFGCKFRSFVVEILIDRRCQRDTCRLKMFTTFKRHLHGNNIL